MAKANPLKQITTKAKQLRKKNPKLSWRAAVESAGLLYRKAHQPKKRTAKKRSAKKSASRKRVKSVTVKRRSIVSVKRVGTPGMSSSPSLLMGAAKKLLLNQLGVLEQRKFSADKKSTKNQLQKKINDVKVQIRKLQK